MTKRRPRPPQTKAKPTPPRSRRAGWLWLAAILVLTFAVYLPCLDNDFTNWDDPVYVTENALLRHPGVTPVLTTPISSNYHPLTIWSLALNYHFSGLKPASYHWGSLLLHLANTALVFVFIRNLSRDRLWATVVTSLFFGIHPMHVESVAWIAERKDVLYAFFYLLGLIAYLRYVDRRALPWLMAALVAFFLSVASKPAAVVFPLTLFAIDFYRKRPYRPRILLEKIPFLAGSTFVGVLTLQAQRASGAVDPHQWGPFHKLLFAAYSMVMYVAKLFVPVDLSAIYPYPNVAGKGVGAEFYVAFGLFAVLVPAVVYLCRRRRGVLFGLAFFFINIVLVLQVFTLGQAVMADRYTYISYVGLLFAVAWWLDERPRSKSAGAATRSVLAGYLLVLVPVSLVQTWKRCDVWQSSETLWNDTIRKYPRRIVDAYLNRGEYYIQKAKRYDAALADFDQAIALNPRVAKVWFNKGVTYSVLNRIDSALVCYDRAVQIQPNYVAALNNRGAMKLQLGDAAGAVSDFARSIAEAPRYRDPYANRTFAYAMLQEYEKSIADGRRAVELNPSSPDNYLQYGSMGESLHHLKRDREALSAFDEAIRLAPRGEARLASYYLGRSQVWAALGDSERARADATEAARRAAAPDSSQARRLGG